MLLVFACKGRPGKEPEKGPDKDSTALVSAELLNVDSKHFQGPYTEFGIFGFWHYEVRIQSFYYYDDNHDDYSKACFILVRDRDAKVADTMMIDTDEDDLNDVEVDDLSDSLKFNSLILKVRHYGRSDLQIDEFFEFKDGELASLFSIEDLVQLRKIDDRYLAAVVRGRDDVLAWGYDYPAIVDLQNSSVWYRKPDTQAIKHETVTLEPVTVYKQRGETLTQPYQVKTGTPVVVDTFWRNTGLIRMLLPDSTPVYIFQQDLREKVQVNAAG